MLKQSHYRAKMGKHSAILVFLVFQKAWFSSRLTLFPAEAWGLAAGSTSTPFLSQYDLGVSHVQIVEFCHIPWPLRLGHKRPHSFQFVHWNICSWNLELTCKRSDIWGHRDRRTMCRSSDQWSSWAQPSSYLCKGVRHVTEAVTLQTNTSTSWIPPRDLHQHHTEEKNDPATPCHKIMR